MAFNLRDRLFGYFGYQDKLRDSYRDGAGRGLHERFNRLLGETYDETFGPLIDNYLANTLLAGSVLPRLLPYLEEMLGTPPRLANTLLSRRRLLTYILSFYKIKGTPRGYTVMFKMLGFTGVTLTEEYRSGSLDSDRTLDAAERRLDGQCEPCSSYAIELTGALPITPAVIEGVYAVIAFNEPINARLTGITYNGGYLVNQIITVRVTPAGDLMYENAYDPALQLRLVNGDLLVSGPQAARYAVNAAGDLVYTV